MERQEREERRQARRVLEKGGDDELIKPAEDEADTEQLKKPGNLLADPRFAKIFRDEAFAIDEHSHEFRSLNPSTKVATATNLKDDAERKLTAVEEEALTEVPASESDDDSDPEEPVAKPKDNGRISSSSYKKSGHRPQQPQLRVTSSTKPAQVRDRSFGSRAMQVKSPRANTSTVVGEREITFAPQRKEKKKVVEIEQREGRRDKDRRSASGNVFRGM